MSFSIGKIISYFLLPLTLTAQSIQWNAPTTISNLGVDATNPQVGVATSGDVVAIWVENGVIKASSLPFNGSWSSITTISNAGASALNFVVDPSGNATAVWLETGVLKAASQPAGGSWGAATSLSGLGTATSPALAVDPSGNVIAGWVQTSVTTTLQSSTKLAGGNWPVIPDTISGSTVSPSFPSVSIGADGTVVAVWHSMSGTNDIINSSRKTIAGGVWGTPVNFFAASAAFHHNYPKVVVDSNGNANAVWFRFNQVGSVYTNVILLSSQLPAGSATWAAIPTLLTEIPSIINPVNLYLRMAADTTGNIIALWTASFDGETFNVKSAVQLYGGSWNIGGALVLVNQYAFEADVAVNTIGDSAAAYMFYDGTNVVIQSAESDVASQRQNYWAPGQTISQGSENGYPRIATSLSGNTANACAVWIHNNGSNNIIHAATGSKTEVLPPSNLTVVQSSTNFGIFTDYFNTISWQASTDPNLNGYAIYRNGVYVASIDSNTLQFVDHNAVQNGSVTYGIAAINTESSQGQIVNVSFP